MKIHANKSRALEVYEKKTVKKGDDVFFLKYMLKYKNQIKSKWNACFHTFLLPMFLNLVNCENTS